MTPVRHRAGGQALEPGASAAPASPGVWRSAAGPRPPAALPGCGLWGPTRLAGRTSGIATSCPLRPAEPGYPIWLLVGGG